MKQQLERRISPQSFNTEGVTVSIKFPPGVFVNPERDLTCTGELYTGFNLADERNMKSILQALRCGANVTIGASYAAIQNRD